MELKTLHVEKEENRTVPRTIRTELALSRNLEKEKSIETREAPGQDQGECREGESSQENAEQAFQLEIHCKGRKSRICSHKILPRPIPNLRRTGGVYQIRETTLGGAVENMRMDCAGGMLISPKKLENVLKKLKNGKGSPDQITADVLKALLPECLEKLARSLSLMCWDMDFPEDWLCSLTVMAPKVVGATCLTKFRLIAGHCAMRKVLGYVWLKSLPPLRYESVQTAFVPKTHAEAGLCLLLKAAELSREWQREMVVVQLDVNKAFDHVDHRAAFKAMKLQGVSLFSMALIAAIWSGSCMKACLGTVTSNKVQMSRGLPQGAPESPVIFTMIMELVLRDLLKSWISRKLAWRLDDFTLAAICYADEVVLIAVSVSAAEILVSEVIEKLKEVGLTVGAQKTHWTSFPKMMDKNITVDGSAVVWEEVLEFVGSMVCLDGNARHAIAHRTAQANKCRAKCKLVLNSPWLPKLFRLNIIKTTMWQAFLWSSNDGQGTGDKIASWSARMVANVVGVKRPPGMELGQWWRLWHRNGHRWIEKCNMNVLVAIRDRMLSWAGHVARMDYKEICAKALRCRGLQWWRWRQLNWKEVERQMVWPTPTAVQHLQVGRHGCWGGLQICWKRGWSVENCPRQHGLVAFCSKPWEAGSNFRNVERALYGWSRVPRGPKRVRHDWDECSGCLADRGKNCEGEIWRALATPLSVSSQLGHCLDALHGTVLAMVGWDHRAAGVKVDVADGLEMPRTFGSA